MYLTGGRWQRCRKSHLFLPPSILVMAVTFMRPILIATMKRWQPVRVSRAAETWIRLGVFASPPGDHGQVFQSWFLNTNLVLCTCWCVVGGVGKVGTILVRLSVTDLKAAFIKLCIYDMWTIAMTPHKQISAGREFVSVCTVNIVEFIY